MKLGNVANLHEVASSQRIGSQQTGLAGGSRFGSGFQPEQIGAENFPFVRLPSLETMSISPSSVSAVRFVIVTVPVIAMPLTAPPPQPKPFGFFATMSFHSASVKQRSASKVTSSFCPGALPHFPTPI